MISGQKSLKKKMNKRTKEPSDESGTDSSDNTESPSPQKQSKQIDYTVGNAKWAKSLADILGEERTKGRKTLILSKSKKAQNRNDEKQKVDFEIDGEIKEEKPDTDVLNKEIESKRGKTLATSDVRIKPMMMDQEREKVFKKIATKGVVQLFNAVRAQQKDLKQKLDDAGPLDHRRDAVLNNINKKKFLDVLMGGERAKSIMVDNSIKMESKQEDDDDDDDEPGVKSQWSVLRNDFMTNKKMSHWDKDEDEDDENDEQEDNESDTD